MQMDAGLDTGPMLLTRRLPLAPDETSSSLHDKLAVLGGEAIVAALDALVAGTLPAQVQPASGVCYAAKVGKADGELDWRRPAAELERVVRAFEASARFAGTPLKIHQATVRAASGAPGEVLAADRAGILVACGCDALLISVLQKAGGKRLAARDFLAGFSLRPGQVFDLPEAALA